MYMKACPKAKKKRSGRKIWKTAWLLALLLACKPTTETTITISHNGLDIKGGCEDLIAFHIDHYDPYTRDTTRVTTPFYRFDCEPNTIRFDGLLRGWHHLHIWAFDDHGNVNPTGKPYGWVMISGHDSSYTVWREGQWLIFERTLSNLYQGLTHYIETAYVEDGVRTPWLRLDSGKKMTTNWLTKKGTKSRYTCTDTLDISDRPRDTFHARMSADHFIRRSANDSSWWDIDTLVTKYRVLAITTNSTWISGLRR